MVINRSELRQEGFSWELHFLLISTIRIWRQIANEMLLKFKSGFFNRIGRKRSLKTDKSKQFERPQLGKADIAESSKDHFFCSTYQTNFNQ